jgi:hypothetical protein
VSPLGAGVKLSVVQTDQVIIALPGDKSKMSIYEKNPSGEGFDFNWRLYVLRGI